MLLQDLLEALDRGLGGSLELASRRGVVGNEVDLGFDASQQLCQAERVLDRVVHAVQHDIFKGDASPGFQGIMPAGGKKRLDRIALVHRHDPVTHLVGRRVQRYGKVHLPARSAEFLDLRDQARR